MPKYTYKYTKPPSQLIFNERIEEWFGQSRTLTYSTKQKEKKEKNFTKSYMQ